MTFAINKIHRGRVVVSRHKNCNRDGNMSDYHPIQHFSAIFLFLFNAGEEHVIYIWWTSVSRHPVRHPCQTHFLANMADTWTLLVFNSSNMVWERKLNGLLSFGSLRIFYMKKYDLRICIQNMCMQLYTLVYLCLHFRYFLCITSVSMLTLDTCPCPLVIASNATLINKRICLEVL